MLVALIHFCSSDFIDGLLLTPHTLLFCQIIIVTSCCDHRSEEKEQTGPEIGLKIIWCLVSFSLLFKHTDSSHPQHEQHFIFQK